MIKSPQQLKVILIIGLSIINLGCRSMTDSNRQLNEPVTGAFMIGRDAIKSLT